MEDVTQSPTIETTQTAEPAAVEPSPAPSAPVIAASTPNEGGITPSEGTPEAAAPEWKPNLKVKAYDKEYEIPAEFQKFITKENEEMFRKTFSKAFAVEEMTEKNKKYHEKFESVNKDHTVLTRAVDKIEKYRDSEDFDRVFEMLKIDEQKLQKWMYNKLQLKSLPPEQQEIYNKKSEYQKQLYEKEEQLEYYKKQFETTQAQTEQQKIEQNFSQLTQAVSRPEIASIAKSFDARLGQEGAFIDEVLQRAAFHEQRTGKTLSIDDAIQNVLKVISASPQTSGSMGSQTLPPQADRKPTLPNIAGKTTSPAAQKINSVEDLRKLRNGIIASQVPQ